MFSIRVFANELQNMVAATRHHFPFVLGGIGLLWALHLLNTILGHRLNQFGLLPRTTRGLPGIIISPFLHGNFNHLFFNSIPLFVLACLVLLHGYFTFWYVTITVVLLSGSALWLFGRRALHIGASSLIMGYFGYLLADAYFQLTPTTVILAIVCVYYFGGSALLAIFPSEKSVSWEGHFFGLAAGLTTAYIYPFFLVLLR
jgi:membrane associated rhomboid family serine protease